MKNFKDVKFSASYTSINTYVEQNADSFIPSVIGKIRTLDYVTPVLDVKTSKVVPVVSNTIDFVSNSSCSTFANGATTSFTGVTLTTTYLKTEESICLSELETYFPKWMKRGSDQQDLPLENAFFAEKENKIAQKIDKITWVNGNGVTGFIQTATASGATVLATQSFSTSTAITNGIILTFDNMVDSLDATLLAEDDLVLFCGNDSFKTYNRSVRNLNLYHYDAEDIKNGVVPLMGINNVKLVATSGLDGSNKALLAKGSWLFFATDILPEDEAIQGQYDFVLDKYLMRYKVKLGVGIANPTLAVVAKS